MRVATCFIEFFPFVEFLFLLSNFSLLGETMRALEMCCSTQLVWVLFCKNNLLEYPFWNCVYAIYQNVFSHFACFCNQLIWVFFSSKILINICTFIIYFITHKDTNRRMENWEFRYWSCLDEDFISKKWRKNAMARWKQLLGNDGQNRRMAQSWVWWLQFGKML